MKMRIAAAAVCLAAFITLPGCSSILEDDIYSVTAHEKPAATASDSIIEASTYDELKSRIRDFVKAHEETGLVRVNSYEGSIAEDVNRACIEMMRDDPYTAYAVSYMTGKANKVVSYHEVVFNIDYNNDVTKKQLESITSINPVATLRYLKSVIQDKLTGYAPSLTVLTQNIPLSESDKDAIVSELYYENPMGIVMMPITTVEFYPKQGTDRIADFKFGYSRYEPDTLKAMAESLVYKVRRVAQSVTESSDGAILLSLCQKLADGTEYDGTLAQSGDYSNQNIVATAYGALINGSAIGEGYAMAYKALCDELGYECYVVVGELDGMPHAWNIVELDGYYYHVDASMCDVGGFETAFLKNDDDMIEHYNWNKMKYKVCNGPLTYASLTEDKAAPTDGTAAVTDDGIPEPTT